jgi:hypothetical protein
MPFILAQKESLRGPPSGCGGFKFIPCFFAEARPLAFNPPLGFFPSFRVQAGDFAIFLVQHDGHNATRSCKRRNIDPAFSKDAVIRDIYLVVTRRKSAC